MPSEPAKPAKPSPSFAHAAKVWLGVFGAEIIVFAWTVGLTGRLAGKYVPDLIRSGTVDIATLYTAYQVMVPLSLLLAAIAGFDLVRVCIRERFVPRKVDVPTVINMVAAAMFSLTNLIASLFGIIPDFPPVAGIAIAAVVGTAIGFFHAIRKALDQR